MQQDVGVDPWEELLVLAETPSPTPEERRRMKELLDALLAYSVTPGTIQ